MGRPINKKFFGNTNTGGNRTGTGGEGVGSVTISNSGTLYSQGVIATISLPQIAGGTRATATPVIPTSGALSGQIVGFNITNPGSGYTSATLTVTTATGVVSASTGTSGAQAIYPATTTGIFVGMRVTGSNISSSATYVTSVSGAAVNLTWPNSGTVNGSISFISAGSGYAGTVVLTSNRQNALNFLAWVPTASNGTTNSGGSAVLGDIVKQQGTKRYYVKTAQGYGVCSLVATTPAIGQMTLEATDANSNTYYVTRLESKKARLTRKTQSGANAWVYANNDLAKWTLAAANGTNKTLATTTVQIANF
jgi:hypothetical protein